MKLWRRVWAKFWAYKIAWVSFGFALALMLFETWYFRLDVFQFLVFIFTEVEHAGETFMRVGIQALLVFLVLSGFVMGALVSRPSVKAIYMAAFAGIIFLEYGYQYATGNYLSLQDIYTASASPQHWDEAITTYLSWMALGPVLGFGSLLWQFRARGTHGLRLLLAIVAGAVGLNLLAVYYAHLDSSEQLLKIYSRGPSVSLPSFFRVVSHLGLEQLTLTQFSRQTLSFQTDTQPNNNVVFILDESVRYDHLSLNGYERQTTPFLEALKNSGVLYNWGLAVSGATCSLHSGAMLFTGVNDLPDETYALRQWPSVFQYAKAMNYTVHYFDAEANELRFPFGADDLAYLDHVVFRDDLGFDYDTDLRLADQVATILNESTGNFVVILKRGAHFPYSATFPNEQARWTPILGTQIIISDDTERVVNSYDNAIYYNINNFFERLLVRPEILDSTVIVYTSDHAQNLGEAKHQLIHCGKTRFEASVPLLLISGRPLAVDLNFKAAHRNIFAALLDFMNVPESERVHPYGLSLLKATAGDSISRRYFYGSIFGLGEHGWVDFD